MNTIQIKMEIGNKTATLHEICGHDLLKFKNGIYNLSTRQFHPTDCNDSVLTTGYDYIEFGQSDETVINVENFMSQLFPDPQVYDSVLNMLFSFLHGLNPDQKFHIWVGSGSNGKSTLLKLLQLALGSYLGIIPIKFLRKNDSENENENENENDEFPIWIGEGNGGKSTLFQLLHGCRVLLVDKSGIDDDELSSGQIKSWVGGDMGGPYKLIYCCNRLPKFQSLDAGLLRRRSITQFGSKFVTNPNLQNPCEFLVNPYLGDKLVEWRQAFMWILLQHHKLSC